LNCFTPAHHSGTFAIRERAISRFYESGTIGDEQSQEIQNMLRLKLFSIALLISSALCFIGVNEGVALAQGQEATTTGTASGAGRDEVNYDVQLDLIVASNNAAERGSVPPSLEGVVKQLGTSLPFTHYRLTTTFINRVRDGGNLDSTGVGSSLLATTIGPSTPTFYNFNLNQIKTERDAHGQPLIRIQKFRFNLRVPIITGTTLASASSPVINYETLGISTEMNVREGVPTLAGTLMTGRPEELMLILISMKPSPQR
jgi:hypothetical protein